MLTHHWTNMHGCTFGSKVLSCIGITSTRPILCFVLISMHLFSVPYTDQFYRYHTFQETWSAPKKYALHHPNITPGCNLTQSMGSYWWWSLVNIVWSSDCHLIAIRWSLLRPVWYHGWIVAQSSDHDAVAGVSVVTLVALLTLGTFGNHASAPLRPLTNPPPLF